MSHALSHPPISLTDRAVGAYVGLAIGDALGATVEFLTPREIRHSIGIHQDIVGGGWLRLKPGQVTDDTTMSLALGQALLADQGKINAVTIAQHFDAWMRAKPVDIGNTVRRNLIQFRRTGDPVAPYSEHDAGNGALMRLLPIALVTFGQTQDQIRHALNAQSHITHNNALSDRACQMVCAMLHGFLAGQPLRDIHRKIVQPTLAQEPLFLFRGKRVENPSGYVVDTVKAILQSLYDTDSFEKTLIDVVNRGGDADTTGAIAGMLAGALHGPNAIPRHWFKNLQADILDQCRSQAKQLIQFAQHSQTSAPF